MDTAGCWRADFLRPLPKEGVLSSGTGISRPEVPIFLDIPEFSHSTVQGTAPCQNQLDSSVRFDTTPTCDRHTDGDAENAGLENAGLENAGTSCVWVAKCNIINVRGHEDTDAVVDAGAATVNATAATASETDNCEVCLVAHLVTFINNFYLSCGHQHGFSSVSAFDV